MQFFYSPVSNPSSVPTDTHTKRTNLVLATSGHCTLICFNHLNSDYTTGRMTQETWFDSLFFLLSETAITHHITSGMNTQNCEIRMNKVKADRDHTKKVF
jgi:hypothetical protein